MEMVETARIWYIDSGANVTFQLFGPIFGSLLIAICKELTGKTKISPKMFIIFVYYLLFIIYYLLFIIFIYYFYLLFLFIIFIYLLLQWPTCCGNNYPEYWADLPVPWQMLGQQVCKTRVNYKLSVDFIFLFSWRLWEEAEEAERRQQVEQCSCRVWWIWLLHLRDRTLCEFLWNLIFLH